MYNTTAIPGLFTIMDMINVMQTQHALMWVMQSLFKRGMAYQKYSLGNNLYSLGNNLYSFHPRAVLQLI